MNSSPTRTQQIIRHTLTLAMSVCFIAAGWLLLKPLVRPACAEAAATSALPWTTKAIEEVAVGDLVLARDEHGTALGWKPVKEVYRRTSYHLRHLTFRDAAGHEQTFETTDEHPFWSVTAKKFVNAGDLSTGDRVVSVPSHTKSGKTPIDVDPALIQTLTASHRDEHPDGITVFNFQVEDFHTYFVAARGATGPPVLVHNANANYRMTPDQQALKEFADEASLGGRKALAPGDADTLLDWADEVNYPMGSRASRASAADLDPLNNHWTGGPHIHIDGVGSGHLPVLPGVTPR